ncbi:MAG: ribosomal L7Ae/L30e/S12e/Gadd45 family protein [Oscillospiraceae bacterium]|nr:ribosomal L7Ae/L30e/S12e/Gadd45 family protein [Oscillospiraceae bacterium]
MNSNKTLNLLTICAKAGRLTGGFEKSMTAVKDGKSGCILLASDVSEKTAKEARFVCQKYGDIPVFVGDFTASQAYIVLKKEYAVFSVNDKGFAAKFAEYAKNENATKQ